MTKHTEKVVKEFTKQAETFNEYQKNFSKEEYTDFAIKNIRFAGNEDALEVAAGTCGFGRSIAGHVRSLTEFDITKAMLDIGRQEAAKLGLNNVSFVNGNAEAMPFEDSSFDCVLSRLAFHHFANTEKVFSEMVRVLKKNGKLVIIDMEAREEALRNKADFYDTLRDPSHLRCVSRDEFFTLCENYAMNIDFCETIAMPVLFDNWLAVTKTPDNVRDKIISAMEEEISGGKKTGFEPYKKDGKLFFDHKWMLLVCRKKY